MLYKSCGTSTKVSFMKQLLLLFLFFINTVSLFATHIAGGEMTYTFNQSTGRYNVSLVIYRDDFYGNPGATYDSPATIVVYDQNGNYVQTIYAPFNSNMVINNIGLGPGEFPPCAAVPTNIRIQKYTYNIQFTPPNLNMGYYFVYARCCRNGSLINNLLNPDNQGGKYVAYIPPTNLYRNNSPTFVNNPKVFFCLNTPLSFDQSATDVDGDQLVYSLCAPYQGLTPNNPIIQQGDPIPGNFGPPFSPVVWAGGYGPAQPLGAASNLSIDPVTGILTGTPTQQGTFVVGICVEEYRNGVLLSTTLRDFQYTVIPCDFPTPAARNIGQTYTGTNPQTGQPITALIIERNCEDFTINFVNQSSPPSGVSFSDLTFTWEFGDGNRSNAVSPTHTYADTGIYLVKLKVETPQTGLPNDCGSDSTYYWVLIYPDYTADFEINPNPACIGDLVTFTNTSFSNYDIPVSWRWTFGNGNTSTTENATQTYNNTGNFNVQLRVTTEKGCIKTATKQLTISPSPVAAFTLPTSVCVGNSISLTNTSDISGGSIVSYNWNFGNGTNSSQQNPNVTYNTPGNYTITLVVTSDRDCTNSTTRNITVNPLPNITITPNTTICPNTSIQLNASGGNSYLWSPAAFLSNPNIANPVANIGEMGQTFTVRVTNAQGCVDSASVFIDVFPLPLADAGEDTSVCLNIDDLTVFNSTVPLQASGGISYSWSPPTGLSNPNTASTNASPTVNTTYTVTVTDANGCSATDTVRVTVLNPALDLIQVDVDSVCFGDTVYVSVLDQGPVSTYTWTPSSFVTDPSANAPGFFPPSNTVYTLAISNYCYQDQDDVLIEVIPLPNLSAGPLDSICIGENYQLNASPGNLAFYEWTSADNSISNPNIPNPFIQPEVTSEYFLFAIDSVGTLGCTNTSSVTIIVYPLPDIEIRLPNGFPGWICLGDNIRLEAVSSTGVAYQWSSNNATNFTVSSSPVTFASPTDTTLFFVTTTNIHGCQESDSVIIDVQLPINPGLSGDSTMCFGEEVNLVATGGLYYEWQPARFFTNSTAAVTQASPDSSMLISVNISNDCFDADLSKFITVYQLPFVDAGEDITIFRDEFDVLSGSGAGFPLWYTTDNTYAGILSSPDVFDPEVSPFNTTQYILEITDPVTECKNYDTATVFVDVLTLLAFPTGFTPNGDGVNDFARIIKYLNIQQLIDLSIYNRFGEAVFRTNDIDIGWDGTYKGKDAEIGVYVWVIRAITKDEEEVLRKGNITLIR
jgi:gliding motility-associated-like protein